MKPMLATKGERVPIDADWSHEVKWDGMRVLVATDGETRCFSRNENDVTVSFPELSGLAAAHPGLLLDGELVAFADGRPDFGVLAERMHVGNARRAAALAESIPVTFLVFDLLRQGDRPLIGLPLAERRDLLATEGLAADRWQVPPAYDDGEMLWQATFEQGLEGVVSKRLSSRYEPGQRSRHWLKFPHRRRGSYVVGGWRPETDSTSRLGAVLVGEMTSVGLRYRGRVGSGIAGKVGPMLLEVLTRHPRASSPFVGEVPRLDALGAHWVEPLLVVEVEALGLSGHDRLRQPAYRGVRTDLTPADLIGVPQLGHFRGDEGRSAP
ncbi:MAG: DNA ligase [Nocardioides sp.]